MASRSYSIWIVLLEDNWQQAADIREDLRDAFADSRIDVFKTVSEFDDWLKKTGVGSADLLHTPDIFILDMMVRGHTPDPKHRLESLGGVDFFTAGAKCFDALAEKGLERSTLIYTAADKEDLEAAGLWERLASHYVPKSSVSDDSASLIKAIVSMMRDQG